MSETKQIEQAYQLAKERYAKLSIDTDKVLENFSKISISLHCWQADDVGGFESDNAELGGGGIQVTGNYPGKARTIVQLRADIEKVLTLIPGKHRLNLHASYADFAGKPVDRDKIEPRHFQSWIDWAKKVGLALDFNSTLFSHPKSEDGYSLSSLDPEISKFWIEHVKRCRVIAEHMGKELGSRVVHNIWIPDGSKDVTVNRYAHRKVLNDSLDEIFKVKHDPKYMVDSIESKLFGIGSESYVVGSHEFYMGYGLKNNQMICLDMGHFHPTENIGDKISSLMLFQNELMLHVSRGIRWDSDHVVIMNDDLHSLTHEIVRGGFINRVNIGLDFFDASINRIGAYVVGTRSTLKSFLLAMLEPVEIIRKYENANKNFEKLAMLEEIKTLPMGAVWDYYCMKANTAVADSYISEIEKYEQEVTSKRK